MGENEDPQKEQPQDAPRGSTWRRPHRSSGEGLESVMSRLREQESQRTQDDRSAGSGGN